MAHSDCGRTCGCTGKTEKSLENTCHTWALLRWWFTTKRRCIKCMHIYLYHALDIKAPAPSDPPRGAALVFVRCWFHLRFDFDSNAIRMRFDRCSTAIRPRYDHSTTCVTTVSLHLLLHRSAWLKPAGYITATLITFDKQSNVEQPSNAGRIEVES